MTFDRRTCLRPGCSARLFIPDDAALGSRGYIWQCSDGHHGPLFVSSRYSDGTAPSR